MEFEACVEFWGRENFVTITSMRAVAVAFFWISNYVLSLVFIFRKA